MEANHRRALETEVRERTAELEASLQRLRVTDRLAAIGTLSAGIGHDMGNLLLPVRVRLQAMQARGLPAEFAPDVEAIGKAAEYLQRLTNGLRLLALDPQEDGQSGEVVDLAEWWADAEPLLRNVLPRQVKGHRLLAQPAGAHRFLAHRCGLCNSW